MNKTSFEEAIDHITSNDSRFPRESYGFVREALEFTIKKRKKSSIEKERHVNGKELLDGIREFALEQFGPLSRTVMEYWNVKRCEDFGEIVFNMVSGNILKTTENDTREDFKGGYDFEEAFQRPFEPPKPLFRKAAQLSNQSGWVTP
jgi:uncharacterized repeat protein (TIGR04138 family)